MEDNLKQYAQLHDENIELKKEIERLKGELFGKSEQLEWIKINPNETDIIPDENVWTFWLEVNEVRFSPKDEYIPLGAVSHYMLLTKPEPPKQ